MLLLRGCGTTRGYDKGVKTLDAELARFESQSCVLILALGGSFRSLWRVESTTTFDCLLLIVLLIVFCGGLLESWLHAGIPAPVNGFCFVLNVTPDQELRFGAKRWIKARAPKPSRKQPAVVGSGTAS